MFCSWPFFFSSELRLTFFSSYAITKLATFGGKLVMAEFVSFAQVKEQVSIRQVLEHYELVEGLRVQKGGDELVGLCPLHQEEKGSFHVSLSKNAFHCFGCQRKGAI